MFPQARRDFKDDQNCFVCGEKNPAGLRLEFREGDSEHEVVTEIIFPAHLQGWQGTVHGGLLATVLDEIMIKAAKAIGSTCVTAEITVKYRKPAATGVSYHVSGRVLASHGRLVTAESRLCDSTGQILAQATGKLFKV
jgi:uncharacterized protein (TIGR00369 family)